MTQCFSFETYISASSVDGDGHQSCFGEHLHVVGDGGCTDICVVYEVRTRNLPHSSDDGKQVQSHGVCEDAGDAGDFVWEVGF
ncbi:hypothetical protein AZG88_04555 [Rhodococcus sp. LB1]|nr:hypothetical protein AZG88_04555 [Rhodococcus sp. LB1]